MNKVRHTIPQNVVVVGAGQAGFAVCAKLRSLGFTGSITLIGDEPDPPYQRPPLSKNYLLEDIPREKILLRPNSYYTDEHIDLRTSTSVVAIEPLAQKVKLCDQTSLPYDKLVLATGSHPVMLSASMGGNLTGVHAIRTLADAERLRPELKPNQQLLIVGGGYIGLEAAAVAIKSGMKVTLIEATDRILKRVTSEQTSDYFRDLHRQRGVDIREGITLQRLNGTDGSSQSQVSSADLSDGSRLDVSSVIVGIGIRPNVALAEAAGLKTENGICVDRFCRTSDEHIFAIGDCASFPYEGTSIRLESIGHAVDQGRAAAQIIMGEQTPYQAKPRFWSDQYEDKLQIVGLSKGYDRVVTRKNSGEKKSFWYFAAERLLAVETINDPIANMFAKRFIEAGKSPDIKRLSDPNTEFKTLLQ